VWCDLGAARHDPDIVRGLAQRGVLVRAGGALGRPGALRVTVGTQAENERFLEALGALL
jgi:histidinol-phosphate aminotransferase